LSSYCEFILDFQTYHEHKFVIRYMYKWTERMLYLNIECKTTHFVSLHNQLEYLNSEGWSIFISPGQRPCELLSSIGVRRPSYRCTTQTSIFESSLKPLNQVKPNQARKVLGWVPFKIVSHSPALHSRYPLLLKIEISSIVHCCFIINQNELKFKLPLHGIE
jgi:hypothetical protein